MNNQNSMTIYQITGGSTFGPQNSCNPAWNGCQGTDGTRSSSIGQENSGYPIYEL